MFTASAVRADLSGEEHTVLSRTELAAGGWSSGDVRRQLEARRWQRVGRAVVVHNGPLTRDESWRAALINCGPRSVLTSFTALDAAGLTGWTRREIHVLAPAGVAQPHLPDLPVVLHRVGRGAPLHAYAGRRYQRPAHAAIVAASSFGTPRPGCGLLAATIQQRLARPADLTRALAPASRTRHRAALLAAVADIAMGAQALSEIDFVRLCRRRGLPPPAQQTVRRNPSGRRRYLDAEWIRPGGGRVVVEVDGALHLVARRWWDDQLRQNELVLAGASVLRFPSVIVRLEPELVVQQLQRALAQRS